MTGYPRRDHVRDDIRSLGSIPARKMGMHVPISSCLLRHAIDVGEPAVIALQIVPRSEHLRRGTRNNINIFISSIISDSGPRRFTYYTTHALKGLSQVAPHKSRGVLEPMPKRHPGSI